MTWNDDDLDRALGSLRREAVPEPAVQALHARVMSEVNTPRAPWWKWVWAVPVMTAAVLVALIWSRPSDVAAPPLIAQSPAAPPIAFDKTKPAPAPRVRRTTPVRRPEPPMEATETPGMIRIASSNPNIVILWSLDSGATPERTETPTNNEFNQGDSHR